MTQFKCSGRMIDIAIGAGAPGLRIEAWDKDGVCSDFVACVWTGQLGTAEFVLEEEYVRELFPDRNPTLYFRIFDDEDTFLGSTEETIGWVLSSAEPTFRIEVDSAHLPASEDPAPFVVRGRLLQFPSDTYTVKAYDCRINTSGAGTTLVQLSAPVAGNAEDTANAGETYVIQYKLDPTAGGGASAPVPGKQAADLVIRVYDSQEVLRKESAVFCHAPPTATIDVALGDYRDPSEWETVNARLGPAVGEADLAEIQDALSQISLEDDDKINHLACSMRLSADEVRRVVAVANIDGGSTMYALYRALGANDTQVVLRQRLSTLVRIVEDAIRDNIIPALGENWQDGFQTGFATLAGDAALAETLPTSIGTLADLLAVGSPTSIRETLSSARM